LAHYLFTSLFAPPNGLPFFSISLCLALTIHVAPMFRFSRFFKLFRLLLGYRKIAITFVIVFCLSALSLGIQQFSLCALKVLNFFKYSR